MENYFPNPRYGLKTVCFQVRFLICVLATQQCKQALSVFELVSPGFVASVSIKEELFFFFCTFSHAGRNTILNSA